MSAPRDRDPLEPPAPVPGAGQSRWGELATAIVQVPAGFATGVLGPTFVGSLLPAGLVGMSVVALGFAAIGVLLIVKRRAQPFAIALVIAATVMFLMSATCSGFSFH